ncbi:MAG: hypothetical protein R3B70_06940 [Polyangiaceae bacterium]
MSHGDEPRNALEAAARLAREEADDALSDPRWESYTEGILSEDERRELASQATGSPGGERAEELFAPLGDEAQDRFLAAAMGALRAGGSPAAVSPTLPGDAGAGAANDGSPAREERPAQRAPGGEVVPIGVAREKRDSRSRRAWVMAAPVALAAAVAGVFFARGRAGGPLPDYEVSIAAGPAATRGPGGDTFDAPPGAALELAPGEGIRVRLRPGSPVKGPVGARVVLVVGSRAAVLPARVETSGDGAVRVRARVPAETRPEGEPEVWILVGRPGDLPGEGELATSDLPAGSDARLRVFKRGATWTAPGRQGPGGGVPPRQRPGPMKR